MPLILRTGVLWPLFTLRERDAMRYDGQHGEVCDDLSTVVRNARNPPGCPGGLRLTINSVRLWCDGVRTNYQRR